MTVSPDARTPSADLHTLTGSTPPGAGPLVQPFGVAAAPVAEMPDPSVALGDAAAGVAAGLAARRAAAAHPDAEVIALAGRLAALAPRQDRVLTRACVIRDARTAGTTTTGRRGRPNARPRW